MYRRDFRSREPNLAGRLFRRHATAGVELLLDDLDQVSRGRWPADPA
jgi:hypothetical protein